MQTYGKETAAAYNIIWGSYAQEVASLVMKMYVETSPGIRRMPVLDLCCGTGDLLLHFLREGFQATGLDLSEHMLSHAKANCTEYIEKRQVDFVHSDAANFSLATEYGLVVSTYDALNHLPSKETLKSCFQCVHKILSSDGIFIFDINTIYGLNAWNKISVTEKDDYVIMSHGFFNMSANKAFKRLGGFYRVDSGLYERFDEIIFNTAFVLSEVVDLLYDTGFVNVEVTALEDLSTPLVTPECHERVYFIALRS